MVGGRNTVYTNQPIKMLKELTAKSIQAGTPVWFGCDVSKCMASKAGHLSLDMFDFELMFGTKLSLDMSKANRLVYGESEMTHAMTITGIYLDQQSQQVTKFRVENSWGEDRHEKGYLVMTSQWFDEFVFEIVVDKSVCPDEVLDASKAEPIVLPAWDPMGALA